MSKHAILNSIFVGLITLITAVFTSQVSILKKEIRSLDRDHAKSLKLTGEVIASIHNEVLLNRHLIKQLGMSEDHVNFEKTK